MDWLQYKNNYLKNKREDEIVLIERAFNFAKETHKNQKRFSGEPYFTHPLKISRDIICLNFDAAAVCAALLHDVVEEGNVPLKEIKNKFGEETAFLVDGVTKVNAIKYKGIERNIESIKKMFLAVAEDIRVVILKIFDRLHNMETLFALPCHKQKRIALETLDIYASIADRLGMGDVKARLEDSAFPYVYPDEHKWLLAVVREKMHQREGYLKNIAPIVSAELKKENIEVVKVSYRAKHYYSIWKKLLKNDMDFSSIYDLAALRIVVKNIEGCYATLGVIHKLWKPLPGKIKDYIALPKPNGYQSLHTTVFCVGGKITEFQIRTEEMDKEAEYGIIAHWFWEEMGKPKKTKTTLSNKFLWVSQLREWQKEFKKNDGAAGEEFLESLKIDFFRDRIFTLTPKGDVIDLPEGATPVDFAYSIHSEIGDKANGAKVNGKMVPLSYKLCSRDIVEILIQKNRKPSLEWLNFAKTQNAKNRIKKHFKSSFSGTSFEMAKIEQKAILEVADRVGLLKGVASVFSAMKININKIKSSGASSGRMEIVVFFVAKDSSQIDRLKTKLKAVKGVEEVKVV